MTLEEDLTIDAGESLTIPQNATLTIPGGVTLENSGTIANNGTLTIKQGGTLTGGGTVTARPHSSSGDSEPTYAPSLDVGNGGTVKVDPRTPEAGEEVTLTVTPDEGYEAEQVSVTDRDGDPVDVTEHRDGTYTFEQPRGRVTIADTFRQVSRGVPFADMPESYWAYDAIQYVYGEGLMAGTSGSAFNPVAPPPGSSWL